jgi:RNA polymerase primary sigma factor
MRKLETTSESITRKNTTSIKKYLFELSQIPLLSANEEYELSVLAFEENDENARQKLVKHNLRFVVSVAKQYEKKDIALEDLINEGNMGLIKAATKFDPSRGFKFISYAVWWIRRNIISFTTDNSTIRIPSNKSSTNYKINQKCKELEQKLQHEATYHDILNECVDEFTKSEVEFYFETVGNRTTSLDMPVGESNSSDTYGNLIADNKVLKTTHFVNENDINYNRELILNTLEDKLEREVIKLLFGFDGKEPLSLKHTGFVLGVSSERIRQIRDKALRRLKISLKNKSS